MHVRDQGPGASLPARLVGPEEREAALEELKAKIGGMAERATWGDLFVLEPEA